MPYCSQCGELMFELYDGTLQCHCGYTVMAPIEAKPVPLKFATCFFCMKTQDHIVQPEYSRTIFFCDEICLEHEKERKRI